MTEIDIIESERSLTIGTRGSPLALYQARLVQSLLMKAHQSDVQKFPIKIYKTTGDRLQGNLSEFGGKGLFTKELETALIDGDIDFAVHSMKDVPTQSQPELMISAILQREDPRDAFISNRVKTLMDLPQGATVGTASIRRRAQLLSLRPDIRFTLLRGNVGTRLEKLERGDCDATFLACAGLNRLKQSTVITEAISTDIMLPAPAQGAIGIECRREDRLAKTILTPLDHSKTHWAVIAERAFLMALDGSCKTPIAALAEFDTDMTFADMTVKDTTSKRGSQLTFRGAVFSKDGRDIFKRQAQIQCPSFEAAFDLGLSLGTDLKAEIGDRVLWDM